MSWRWLVGAALVAPWLGSGCRELRDIELDRCGNSVLEEGEDCDTEVPEGQACGAPSSASACRFVWTEDASCPAGYGYGLDGVCRAPTGYWDPSASFSLPSGGVRALVGDLDGDLLDELVVGGSSVGRYRAHFLAPGGTARGVAEIPLDPVFSFAAEPALGSLSGRTAPVGLAPAYRLEGGYDLTADLAVPSFGGLTVLRGRDGGTLSPKAYASYPVPRSTPLALPAHVSDRDSAGLDVEGVVFDTGAGDSLGLEFHRRAATEGGSVLLAKIPGISRDRIRSRVRRVEWSADHPGEELFFVASWTTPQGREVDRVIVVALGRDASESEVLLDLRLDVFGDLRVNGQAYAVDVQPLLPVPPDTLEELVIPVRRGGPLGNASLLALARNPVASTGVSVAFDLRIPRAAVGTPAQDVLFTGDFDGDGWVELVDRSTVRVVACEDSADPTTCELQPIYAANSFLPWNDALLDDLNRDGLPDLVASSPLPGVDVVFSLGSGLRLPTSFPVTALHAGDFDGDGSRDILTVMDLGADDCAAEDQLAIAFGRVGAFPEAPVSVGSLPGIGEVAIGTIFRSERFDAVTDFGVVTPCVRVGNTELDASAALFFGTPSRQITSPVVANPVVEEALDITLGAAIGRVSPLGEPDRASVASFGVRATQDGGATLWAWTAPASGDAELDLAAVQRLDLNVGVPASQLLLALTGARGVAVDLDVDLNEADAPVGGAATDELVIWIPSGQLDSQDRVVAMIPRLAVVRVGADGALTLEDIYQGEAVALPEPTAPFASSSDLVAVDLDGDGDLELVGYVSVGDASSAHVFWNEPGGFEPRRLVLDAFDGLPTPTLELRGVAVLASGLPGDGARLVVATSGGIHLVRRSDAPDIEQTLVGGAAQGYTGVATGDFDGDGRADLAALRLEGTDIHLQVERDESIDLTQPTPR